ncbi:MAG: hypothetical protein ACREPL_02720 [Rhodanobacteraceae bacterium]
MRAVSHGTSAGARRKRRALEAAGITVIAEREVLAQRLRQDLPGQLGLLARRLAPADVNVEAMYSDHDHQSILVVDHIPNGRRVSETRQRDAGRERGGPRNASPSTTPSRSRATRS